jgi:hypothetical protein
MDFFKGMMEGQTRARTRLSRAKLDQGVKHGDGAAATLRARRNQASFSRACVLAPGGMRRVPRVRDAPGGLPVRLLLQQGVPPVRNRRDSCRHLASRPPLRTACGRMGREESAAQAKEAAKAKEAAGAAKKTVRGGESARARSLLTRARSLPGLARQAVGGWREGHVGRRCGGRQGGGGRRARRGEEGAGGCGGRRGPRAQAEGGRRGAAEVQGVQEAVRPAEGMPLLSAPRACRGRKRS